MEHTRVKTVVSDQFEYGLTTMDSSGNPVATKKSTRRVTTSEQPRHRLSKRCSRTHRPEPLLGGKTAAAARYPMPQSVELRRSTRVRADAGSEQQSDISFNGALHAARAAVFRDQPLSPAAALRESDHHASHDDRTTTCRVPKGSGVPNGSTELCCKRQCRAKYTQEPLLSSCVEPAKE